jgi:hypothetical protein
MGLEIETTVKMVVGKRDVFVTEIDVGDDHV